MQTPAFWQSRFPAGLLLPLSALFGLLASVRRLLYGLGWLRTARLSVPVVVVGNISAGGAGKTPAVRALATALLAAGFHPAIISRGYGGGVREPTEVPSSGAPGFFGDEPVLLAQQVNCPVFVGPRRVDVARAVLKHYPKTDVLLSDDGLQHYALGRSIEIAVVDGVRGFQNGWLLPAGPLREPISRLQRCDAVVINGGSVRQHVAHPHSFDMQLLPGNAYSLVLPTNHRPLASFAGQTVAAVAGIGYPHRFFDTLQQAGLRDFSTHPMPDHHVFQPTDLTRIEADAILVTEKDAVKLSALLSAGGLPRSGNIWVVPVVATFSPDLISWLISHLQVLTETT